MVVHSDGSNDSGFGFAIFGQGGDSYQKAHEGAQCRLIQWQLAKII